MHSPLRKWPRNRALGLETLENRRLLAADGLTGETTSVPSIASQFDATFAEVSSATPTDFSVTSDAGSTRDTATNIGTVDGSRSFLGRLGWHDQSDVVQFSLERAAEIEVELSQLTRNANLYLTDFAGSLIDYSIETGLTADAIKTTLAAGDYWIAVTSTSLYTTLYTLSISAEPLAPIGPIDPGSNPGGDDADSGSGDGTVAPLPDVEYFGSTRDWNVNAIGAPEAWASGYTGQGVVVAVVDTGVDLDHADLTDNIFVNPGEIPNNGIDDDQNGFVDDVHGYDFTDGDNDPNDLRGHGTHVAGTIAASNNGVGATGIAPDATILPVRVLDADGSGTANDVAAGIRYAARMGADIINLSLGGGYSWAIDSAIDYARSLGSLVVAAAGNESATAPGFPARFSATDDNVISVGASTSSGSIASFSNRVGDSLAVQIDAPGAGIFSTYVGGRYATLSGTSMASPHVAGLAALTLSSNPDLTSRDLRNLLATGTVGRVSGSDAIGSASATTTVAYAAAGLLTSPSLNHASAIDLVPDGSGNALRSTELIDIVMTSDALNSNATFIHDRDEQLLDNYIAPTLAQINRLKMLAKTQLDHEPTKAREQNVFLTEYDIDMSESVVRQTEGWLRHLTFIPGT
ncbi:S8 family peptidase [Rhodopirellula sp. SWK7]|uniref:S8 family peptidase n=1 Tax=Rhodopirellula sp. SWK7 TaxID=595460 RepID=UPI0002BD8D26|nr:S8 family peptidase [Rhodopirellula sp. SWK7]EMI44639.1 Peptidase S8 and S53, subtilisin, kexin, sedolisin domain protein [Rhodopirellula sp. SWK7]